MTSGSRISARHLEMYTAVSVVLSWRGSHMRFILMGFCFIVDLWSFESYLLRADACLISVCCKRSDGEITVAFARSAVFICAPVLNTRFIAFLLSLHTELRVWERVPALFYVFIGRFLRRWRVQCEIWVGVAGTGGHVTVEFTQTWALEAEDPGRIRAGSRRESGAQNRR